ncbi:MAG: hypothetical protein QOH47_1907 [Sphingomonadales bacterium]|jgi:hypothetical protein|nr:hypothetical protein [Sphingomonadales bacterium]
MAVFRIEATPADGLTAYAFWIHGIAVPMKDGAGGVDLDWLTCTSGNFVDYTLEGPAGARLRFWIFCNEGEVYARDRVKIGSDLEKHSESFPD